MSNEQFIYLDSRHSLDPSQPAIATYVLNNGFQTNAKTHIQLSNISFANLVYPINSNNYTLVVEENGASSTISVNLTSQSYTGSQFATEIQTILNANTAEATTYTVSYDSQTRKITISTDGNDFRITSASTILDEIGLYTEMSSASINFTMPYPVRLDGSEYIDLISDLRVDSINSSGRTTILGRIYLDTPYGSLVFWENKTNDSLRLHGEDFNSITLRLVDSKGLLYNLPPVAQVSTVLKLSFS